MVLTQSGLGESAVDMTMVKDSLFVYFFLTPSPSSSINLSNFFVSKQITNYKKSFKN